MAKMMLWALLIGSLVSARPVRVWAASPGSEPPVKKVTPPAGAPREPPASSKPAKKTKKKDLSHRHQLSIDLAAGFGYGYSFTYADTVYCGSLEDDGSPRSICHGLVPAMLDFGVGFGLSRTVDVLVDFRVGLTKDLVKNRPLILMPGIRIWLDPTKPFKIGLAIQVVIDFTKQEGPLQDGATKGKSVDAGGRFYAQFQYDFLRYFGIFGRLAALVTARRWVQLNLEFQLGVQARLP